jgi:hypothetical protein
MRTSSVFLLTPVSRAAAESDSSSILSVVHVHLFKNHMHLSSRVGECRGGLGRAKAEKVPHPESPESTLPTAVAGGEDPLPACDRLAGCSCGRPPLGHHIGPMTVPSIAGIGGTVEHALHEIHDRGRAP